MIPPLELDSFDIALFTATGKLVKWEVQPDDVQRGLALREAFAAWPGSTLDCYLFANRLFDTGSTSPVVVPGCTIGGLGSHATAWTGSTVTDNFGGPHFQLSHLTTIKDIALHHAAVDATEDGICVGFAKPATDAVMFRCSVWAREWGVYCWQPNCRLLFADGDITAGRVCIAAENSGDGQTFTIRNTDVFGDASLSNCSSGNAVSDPQTGGIFGLIARGGVTTLDNVRMTIRGIAAPPRACGITDHGGKGDGPAYNARLVLRNFTCNVSSPNPSAAFDLDLSAAWMRETLAKQGAWGSEYDGALKRSW